MKPSKNKMQWYAIKNQECGAFLRRTDKAGKVMLFTSPHSAKSYMINTKLNQDKYVVVKYRGSVDEV